MKKFRVEVKIESIQRVFYTVEADSKEALEKTLETNCIEDIGQCIDEEPSEYYDETITDITEVENE